MSKEWKGIEGYINPLLMIIIYNEIINPFLIYKYIIKNGPEIFAIEIEGCDFIFPHGNFALCNFKKSHRTGADDSIATLELFQAFWYFPID